MNVPMRRLLIAVVVVLAALPLIASDSDEFLRLEAVWNDAHTGGDVTALERLWADDLTVIVPRMPVMSKADVVAFARSGKMKFQRYETSEINVRRYGSTAVVTGRLLRTRTLGDKLVTDDWRFTKVYVKRKGHWQVVDFHAAESPESR